jgi:phosphatidylglycerol:prolipoprotein diacylglycerol transferase
VVGSSRGDALNRAAATETTSTKRTARIPLSVNVLPFSAPAWVVHHWDPFLVEFGGGFGIRWYGLAYVLAFAAGFAVLHHLARRGVGTIPEAQIGDFITWAAIFGVLVGGRVGHFLFYDTGRFLADPLSFFRLWEGGMASHGGILGLVLFTLFYARRHRLSWRGIGDDLVVAAPIGLFFGRCANFINGELFGRVTSVPWAMKFPKELYDAPAPVVREALARAAAVDPRYVGIDQIIASVPTDPGLAEALAPVLAPRHVSQLYEAGLEGVLLFALLWVLHTRFRPAKGVVTAAFFIGYAALRIVGEMFREPDAGLVWGLTRGQFLSLFMVLAGAAFLIAAPRGPRRAARTSTGTGGSR